MGDLDAGTPYLSVVVASRNDDHGGSLLRRMQTFVNAFVAQCQRHGLSAELILVEWNPPAGRPPLSEALLWPKDLGPCRVRIIEVPPALHQRYHHAGALPLYQMIGKNAGIRRARGKFVLASNIDILFNDEMMSFLAEKKLDPNRMYRVDRYDAMAEVPVDAPPDQQLEYCQTHLLRVHGWQGTLPLTPGGVYVDRHGPEGISFGKGWYPPEQRLGERFRWAYHEAEITVACPSAETCGLRMELEPGPSAGPGGVELEISDQAGGVLGAATVRRRVILQLRLPPRPGKQRVLRFSVRGGGHSIPGDLRVLDFRIFQCERFGASAMAPEPSIEVRELPVTRIIRNQLKRVGKLCMALRHMKEPLRVGLPIPAGFLRRFRARLDDNGLSIVLNPRASRRKKAQVVVSSEPFVHSNACGDFTLMAREHWIDLRGYPEFDLYSFNIDAVLCFAAHNAGVKEKILEEPLRIYHIEHGSGWTPEGQRALFDRLDASGVSFVDWPEVAAWAAQMRRLGSPMIFNRQDWGLGEFELRETTLPETSFMAP
jgi:hypothetical protein